MIKYKQITVITIPIKYFRKFIFLFHDYFKWTTLNLVAIFI